MTEYGISASHRALAFHAAIFGTATTSLTKANKSGVGQAVRYRTFKPRSRFANRGIRNRKQKLHRGVSRTSAV